MISWELLAHSGPKSDYDSSSEDLLEFGLQYRKRVPGYAEFICDPPDQSGVWVEVKKYDGRYLSKEERIAELDKFEQEKKRVRESKRAKNIEEKREKEEHQKRVAARETMRAEQLCLKKDFELFKKFMTGC